MLDVITTDIWKIQKLYVRHQRVTDNLQNFNFFLKMKTLTMIQLLIQV